MKKAILIMVLVLLSMQNVEVCSAQMNWGKRLRELSEVLNKDHDRAKLKAAFDEMSAFEPRSDEDIDAIIESIKSSAGEGREFAAQKALGNVKDLRLVPKIIAALEDKNVHVRIAAIAAVGRLKDKRAVPALVRRLDEEEHVTNAASMALAAIGDESVIPELLARIGRPNGPTSVGLSRFGAPALKAILERIDNASGEGRFSMTSVIGFMHDPRAIPMLRDLLKHKDVEIRQSAVQSLGNMDALDIEEAIKDKDALVRLRVVGAARKARDPKTDTLLINVLTGDECEEVRGLAASVLGERKSFEAVPYLEEAAKRESREVREDAERALIKIRGEKGNPGR